MRAQLSKFGKRLGNVDLPLAANALVALFLKGSGSILMTLCFVLASRALDHAEFGRLAILFNFLAMSAVFATAGQDTLVSRSWGEYVGLRQFGFAGGAVRYGLQLVALSSGIVALLAALSAYLFWGASPILAMGTVLFVFLQAVLHFLSHLTRTMGAVTPSEFHREISWRSVLMLLLVVGAFTSFSLSLFIWSAALGLLIASLLQVRTMNRAMPAAVRGAKPQYFRAEWWRRGRAMWGAATLEACSQYSEVVLLGLITHPEVAASYFVASRIANLFAMISTGLHVATVSRSATLYFSGEHRALQALLRLVMTINLALIVPLFIGLVIGGGFLLQLFGPQYRDAYGTLIILTASSAIFAASGPSGGLLLTTGYETRYVKIISIALVARFLLIAILTPRWGALGAALGTALVNIPMAIVLGVVCRRTCGIDPSFISIFTWRWSESPRGISLAHSKGGKGGQP